MADHTPGPWEIEPKERRDHPLFVMNKEGDRIARCDGLNMADFGPDPQQAKANANLISAAPEMLDALHAVWPWLSWAQERGALCFPAIQEVQKAIAKAKGQRSTL